MFLIIAAVIAALVMVFLMSRRVEEEGDPVWQTILEVDRLAGVIAQWEMSLWSLWVMAVLENLLFRLDESERIPYLNKLGDQVSELQQKLYEEQPMSEKKVNFLSRIDDLRDH